MERMLDACISSDAARLAGYVHLKMLPGAQTDQVRERRGSAIASPSTWRARGRRRATTREGEGPRRRSSPQARAGRPPLARGRLEGRPDRPAPMGHHQFVVGAQASGIERSSASSAASRVRACSTTRTSAPFSRWRARRWRAWPPRPPCANSASIKPSTAAPVPLRLRRARLRADGNLSLEHDPRPPGRWRTRRSSRLMWGGRPSSAAARARHRPAGGGAAWRSAGRGLPRCGGSAAPRRGHCASGLLPDPGGRRIAREQPPLQRPLFADGGHLPRWSGDPRASCAYR